MTPAELLHTDAARYATNRKVAYFEAIAKGVAENMSEEALNGRWLAHYEGYREGYWVATGDSKFTTDPFKDKNNGTV
jgi:hypothetical protein